MYDPDLMGRMEGSSRLDAEPSDRAVVRAATPRKFGLQRGCARRGREVRLFGAEPQLANHFVQRLAVDVLHCVVVHTVFRTDGVHGDDVGVIQLCAGVRFVLKPNQPLRVEHRGQRQDFQSHPPLQRDLPGLEHNPHAASPDLANQLEIAQPPRRAAGIRGVDRDTPVCEIGHGSLQAVHVFQVAPQRTGQIGMTGEDLVDRRSQALFEADQIGVENRRQPLLLSGGQRVAERTVCDGALIHVGSSRSKSSRSRRMARNQSTRVEPGDRPISRATLSKGRPWKCRSIKTSRCCGASWVRQSASRTSDSSCWATELGDIPGSARIARRQIPDRSTPSRTCSSDTSRRTSRFPANTCRSTWWNTWLTRICLNQAKNSRSVRPTNW